jgi:uncharacterized protein (TIGR02271 family)
MNQTMTHTVVGIFDDKSEAQTAMTELSANGFGKENIDLSHRRTSDASTTSTGTAGYNDDNDSVGDSIGNFFSSMFGSDSPQAHNYSSVASETEAVLVVQTESAERASVAAEIMDNAGAVDVDERAAQYQQNQFANTGSTGTSNYANPGTAETGQTIPVIEENLAVGKREVETGGVRVRSRIIERPVEESIRLREEHVTVNRRPVDRAVSEGDFAAFREGDIEITEHAEKAVVAKEARVVEEVSVGKNVTEREETVSDTVRSTEVDVEQVPGRMNVDTDVETDIEHTRTRNARP